jgi:hypothetical protein
MLSTDQKGNIAEAAVALAATRLHIDVYRPVGEGGRYDMILDLEDRLVRVQCKWAPRQGDVVVVRCYSSRRSAAGLVRRKYSRHEIDAVAAYCPDVDRCYFLPIEHFEGRFQVVLRLEPTRKNQKLGINWAESYEFEVTLGQPGAVAQLGERRAGSA